MTNILLSTCIVSLGLKEYNLSSQRQKENKWNESKSGKIQTQFFFLVLANHYKYMMQNCLFCSAAITIYNAILNTVLF